MLTLDDMDGVGSYVAAHSIVLGEADNDHVHDLDVIADWLAGDDDPDAVAVLNAWNLAWDVANSTGAAFAHRGGERDAVYDKVFWANNLPAVTPPGERYEPEWAADEIAVLSAVVSETLAVVRGALVAQ